MIFSSFNHLDCFLVFLFFGIILGFLGSLLSLLFLKKYQKKFIIYIFDTVFFTFFAIFFVFLINIFNFGEFNIPLVITYLLGFLWIKKVCKKMFAILEDKWYNILSKLKISKTNGKKHKKS